MRDITIGVDVGGSKIQTAAVVGDDVRGSARAATPTGGPAALVAAVASLIDQALADANVDRGAVRAIGVGIPGSVDDEAGTVANSPNLEGLQGSDPVEIAPRLSQALDGIEVHLDNDVQVAIRGEWKRGAGRPYTNLLGVWVGTGVGGGLVLGDAVYEGAGAAGEIGHLIVKPGGRTCSDGRLGHLEAYAGRGRMEAYARERVANGDETILFDVMQAKGKDRLTSGVIAKALEKDDSLAKELIDDAVWALGTALASVQNLLALEAIVIGGGLGDRLGEPFLWRIREAMQPLLFVPEKPPEVLPSELGDLAGAVGAAVMAGA